MPLLPMEVLLLVVVVRGLLCAFRNDCSSVVREMRAGTVLSLGVMVCEVCSRRECETVDLTAEIGLACASETKDSVCC